MVSPAHSVQRVPGTPYDAVEDCMGMSSLSLSTSPSQRQYDAVRDQVRNPDHLNEPALRSASVQLPSTGPPSMSPYNAQLEAYERRLREYRRQHELLYHQQQEELTTERVPMRLLTQGVDAEYVGYLQHDKLVCKQSWCQDNPGKHPLAHFDGRDHAPAHGVALYEPRRNYLGRSQEEDDVLMNEKNNGLPEGFVRSATGHIFRKDYTVGHEQGTRK